ncbi:MAG: Glu/Leu/Phe/Val dehydrogenase dimerization domain-containing protein [Pseudomonadota bacterium]
MFDHASFDDHEGVHHFHDAETGLKAIIAIHSTTLGPAAGGCRMWDYATGADMLTDVLRLSQGMSYKNAMAGLPLGGGKAVIWGDPHKDKSSDLFRAFGRAVESLHGRYWTAEDVGLSPGDLAAAAEETKYVAGLESGAAASGDPSPVTALGVYRGILECAKRAYDTDDLNGKRVAVQGVGSVGGGVCLHLAKAGADLIVSDVHQETLSEIASLTGATIVSPDEIYDQDADIFSPNALGAVVNQETLGRLKAKVIAGGANNQLATRDMGAALSEAGVLYAPDYVINGGGIINVAAEISGNYSRDWVDDKLDTLMDTLGTILDQSLAEARPTNEIADEVARQRVGRQ